MPSPSDQTEFGRKVLADDPDCPGSLGIAISEAIEDTVKHPDTKYSLGSVLNHVCLHQTVIGQEAIKQMEMAGEEPDVVIGCAGGGSNFAGIAFPFVHRKIDEQETLPHRRRRAGVVPVADAGRVPLRLRRHGGDDAADEDVHARPRLHAAEHPRRRAALPRHVADGQPLLQARPDRGVSPASKRRSSKAAVQFAHTEGIVPAPESAHAIPAAIDEAVQCREENRKKVILFNLSGHGLLDLAAYDTYLSGKMRETADEE